MGREALLPAVADRRRIIGGAFARALAALHCDKEARVFGLKRRKRQKVL